MLPKIEQVKFDNRYLPNSNFDLVLLQELFSRGIEEELTNIHQVNFYILIFITDNKGKHTIDFTNYPYQKGSVLTIRKDQIQKFYLSDAEGFLLFFTEDFISSYLEQQEALKTLQLFNELLAAPKIQLNETEYTDLLQLITQIKTEYFNVIDTYSLGIIRSLLHILIAKLYRTKSNQKSSLQSRKYLSEFIHFQTLVEQHCFETKKVKNYAQKMGITTKTLNNIVQEIIHQSAKVFIDQILITRIKRLLIHSTLSIKEIAYTVGFEEPTNFYKYFKKLTQHSPDAFRKTYNK